MGGKALKKIGIDTERKNTKEFFQIYSDISFVFRNKLGLDSYVTKFYKNKKTHGDIDILIKKEENDFNFREFIENNFETKGIVSNGGVISFEYNNFQVDIIPISLEIWEVSKTWYSYDPIGNLMGKLAHKFGLKYGHKGLYYNYRSTTSNVTSDVLLSRDNSKIFEFLGFSHEEFLKGFDNVEEIFKWVINSKYFNKSIFEFENLNHVDKKRNKKRDTYNKFLEYVKGIEDEGFKFEEKSFYIDIIEDFFPEVKLKLHFCELREKERILNEISSKFNGNLVMDKYPELSGKELGVVMGGFKSSIDNFDEYILKASKEQVMNDFKNYYE